MINQYIVYDAGEKKIARYQQYQAVKKTIRKVITTDQQGLRKGGVIWHTQGSGKSITMVMLAKAISMEDSISNPKIVVVTDRKDLDEQIEKTLPITVYPDMTIEVNAPEDKKENDIYKIVGRRSSWIIKQINYFKSLPAPIIKRQYVSGETQKYLGKQYRLKIFKSKKTKIKLVAGFLKIFTVDKNNIQTIQAVDLS